MLTVLVLAMAIGLGFAGRAQPIRKPDGQGNGDLALYARVIDRMKSGQGYYPAAVGELRAIHAPLKPFLTIRPPLLATALAALPKPHAGEWILRALAAATFVAWLARLDLPRMAPFQAAFAGIALASGYGLAIADNSWLWHEMWAGLLVALALALHHPRRWGASLAIALLAALVRELAAPVLLVMAAFALAERRPREALSWLAAFALFAAALWLHALRVGALVLPSDAVSPGWVGVNGWPFILHNTIWNAFCVMWPPLAVVLPPLALFGLLGAEDPAVKRAAVTVFGFVAGLAMLGRPENFYWGIMIAPLWPLGLIAAPRMLAGLARDLRALLPRGAPAPAIALAPNSSAD